MCCFCLESSWFDGIRNCTFWGIGCSNLLLGSRYLRLSNKHFGSYLSHVAGSSNRAQLFKRRYTNWKNHMYMDIFQPNAAPREAVLEMELEWESGMKNNKNRQINDSFMVFLVMLVIKTKGIRMNLKVVVHGTKSEQSDSVENSSPNECLRVHPWCVCGCKVSSLSRPRRLVLLVNHDRCLYPFKAYSHIRPGP